MPLTSLHPLSRCAIALNSLSLVTSSRARRCARIPATAARVIVVVRGPYADLPAHLLAALVVNEDEVRMIRVQRGRPRLPVRLGRSKRANTARTHGTERCSCEPGPSKSACRWPTNACREGRTSPQNAAIELQPWHLPGWAAPRRGTGTASRACRRAVRGTCSRARTPHGCGSRHTSRFRCKVPCCLGHARWCFRISSWDPP